MMKMIHMFYTIICCFQIPEAHQIEIGSAVLECLQRDLSEQTGLYKSFKTNNIYIPVDVFNSNIIIILS